MDTKQYAVTHTDEEWRRLLTPEQYEVLRGHATEAPGSCALNFEKRHGTFVCAGCAHPCSSREEVQAAPAGELNDPVAGAVETTQDRSWHGPHRSALQPPWQPPRPRLRRRRRPPSRYCINAWR